MLSKKLKIERVEGGWYEFFCNILKKKLDLYQFFKTIHIKGDISTNTLVAILIGLIVLAIFVYLVFFYSKGSSLGCHFCKSEFAEWCQKCAVAEGNWNRTNWPNNVEMSEDLEECMLDCLKISPNDCGSLRNDCLGYLPNVTGAFYPITSV